MTTNQMQEMYINFSGNNQIREKSIIVHEDYFK